MQAAALKAWLASDPSPICGIPSLSQASNPLCRRRLLQGLALMAAAAVIRPDRALALGGTLPPLDGPAPPFQLEGVIPADPSVGASGAGRPVNAIQGQSPADAEGFITAQRSLSDFAGQWLVLYFYPRDFTSGCTLEARGFQRALPQFRARSAQVVGISADGPDDHAAFCSSEGLVYPLLSDPGGRVSRQYGSWMAPFSLRHTFLIDPQGLVRARWTAVRPAGHAAEVLAELERLQA
jgi:thioredoxin-dependent peroxiredoxin